MIDIALIISGVEAAISIASFLEVTENEVAELRREVAELKQNDFNSAMRALEDARHSEGEQESLLRSARDHFNRAVDFESGLRQAETYLGLAMCHHHLGDRNNSRRALERILDIPIDWVWTMDRPSEPFLGSSSVVTFGLCGSTRSKLNSPSFTCLLRKPFALELSVGVNLLLRAAAVRWRFHN